METKQEIESVDKCSAKSIDLAKESFMKAKKRKDFKPFDSLHPDFRKHVAKAFCKCLKNDGWTFQKGEA